MNVDLGSSPELFRVLDMRKIPFNFGGIATVLGVGTDVTDRKHLEAQLGHAQKMEGIGRLAGGIAHDFNNLLTVVLGGAQELERRLGADDEVFRIREAAERATALTRQLLSFSRQSPVEPRVVSINDLVSGAARLLGRVLGEDLTLMTTLDDEVKSVLIDPGQMDQVLKNLAVNARDATPGGGETVLLLEDDRLVRTLTMRLLKLLGYQVLVAALPGEALTIAREHPAQIDLLMTDVMMPETSGPAAARAIQAIRPEIRVLYVSGYSADALPTVDEETHFLGKPFTLEELAEKLRHVLASPPSTPG